MCLDALLPVICQILFPLIDVDPDIVSFYVHMQAVILCIIIIKINGSYWWCIIQTQKKFVNSCMMYIIDKRLNHAIHSLYRYNSNYITEFEI